MKQSLWFVVAALGVVGCTKTPAYLYGRDVSNLTLHHIGDNFGVYPDRAILDDPDNPFVADPPSEQGKWTLEATAGPLVAFYSWATLTALVPSGESQYYAAHDLETLFRTGQGTMADQMYAKALAIRAYQAVLDHFPDSVTYDKTGKIATGLATLSLENLIDLGGVPQNGWVLVDDGHGHKQAVRQ